MSESKTIKSPFVVIENFLSPLFCEDLIDRLNYTYPNRDINNNIIKTIKNNKLSDIRILPYLEEIIPDIEEYYGFTRNGILPFDYEWFVAGAKDENPRCENSSYTKYGWQRINDYDFTGIIFLNDYQDNHPFDENFEVFGGKLEFPNHQFSFNPARGRLIIFPGNEHFINHTTTVHAGSLTQVRFQIVSNETPWKYNPNNFGGSYLDWFN